MAKTITLVMIGAGVAGLGLASIFPINVLFTTSLVREQYQTYQRSHFFAQQFSEAPPWPGLVGALSSHFGSLRVGFLVPLFGGLSGMLTFYLLEKSSVARDS